MVAHWNLKPARLPIPPYPRKKQATELLFSGSWCEKRDLNPYGKTTRPSNVRVYQFRHSRFSCARDFGLHRCALATVSIIPHLSRNVNTFFQFFQNILSFFTTTIQETKKALSCERALLLFDFFHNAHVCRTNNLSSIVQFFQSMRTPTRHSCNRKHRCKEFLWKPKHVVNETTIKVNVC